MKNKLLLFVLMAFALSTQAQTTMENYNYGTTIDTLTNPTKGGVNWRRHSGTGGPIQYINTSLSYPGYTSSGIGGAANFTFASGSREDANRSTLSFNSGSVYISFLLKMSVAPGASADYFFHILDTTFMTSFRARIYAKNGTAANTYNIGMNKGSSSTPSYASTDFKLDSTILIVIKYTFSAGSSANDTVKVYTFTSGVPATEPAVANIVSTDISTGDLAIFNAVAIRQGTVGTMSGTIDGIRVSNSWADGPLPVSLINFKGYASPENGVHLTWSTAQERENKGFEIEQSFDGTIYENIGFVKGAGNSSTIKQYEFTSSYYGNAYYRLKQIDYNGKFEYSPIIQIQSSNEGIELSPNPFVENIKINSVNTIDKIEIIDYMGRTILSENIHANEAKVNTGELPKGIYFINIIQGNEVKTKRIIKTY